MNNRNLNCAFPGTNRCVIDKMKDFENWKGGWRRVFICFPFDCEDAKSLECFFRYCRYALGHECIPVAPDVFYSMFMDEKDDTGSNMIIALSLLDLNTCDEVWVFGRDYTDEMMAQISVGLCRGKMVRYFRNLKDIIGEDEEEDEDE